MPATINITVHNFVNAVSFANPQGYCTAVPVIVNNANGRVNVIPWPIPPNLYHIIRVDGNTTTEPVDMIFSVLDIFNDPTTYSVVNFKAEQKPTNPRAPQDPDGARNLPFQLGPAKNQVTVMNQFRDHTPTGVYWECYIDIVRNSDKVIGIIDPGVENTD